MRRPCPAVWLLALALLGCKTADNVERNDRRQRELFEVNRGLPAEHRISPRTAWERGDPLFSDPPSPSDVKRQ